MTPTRVVVVDDHPMFLAGLSGLLRSRPELEVVGTASDGREAIAVCLDTEPEVCVMDLHMPELNGIDATRALHEQRPAIGVVVLTMLDDDESVFAAMRAGARGYVLKGADQDEIVRAITAVAGGEAIFGPSIADRMIAYFAGGRSRSTADDRFPTLTEREVEVLEAVARGESNGTIARRLGISDKTARNHVSNIFTKLQVTDRAQAIVRAREAGLGGPDRI
jgi:DNA-binding NarL/FixJ family response regulator